MLFASEGARVVATARTVEEGTHQLAGSLIRRWRRSGRRAER